MLRRPVEDVMARHLDAADRTYAGLVEALYLVGSIALEDFQQLRAGPSVAAPGLFHDDVKPQAGPNMRTPVEWATLARYGLAVRGPEPATIGVHDDPGELAAWTLGNLDALDTFDERWHPIVTEALRCRPIPLAPPESLDQAGPRPEAAAAFMEATAAARALHS